MVITIPVYRYQIIAGDIKTPIAGGFEYTEGSFEKKSTSADLENQSDDFRSCKLLGVCGEFSLDSRWRKHPGGYTDGKNVLDGDDFFGCSPKEGVVYNATVDD